MLFNSVPFVFFFICVVSLYFALPQKWRWLLLLVSSYYFYMCWKAEYALLILFTTCVDFFVARHIAGIAEKRRRKKFVAISLCCNMGILFGFKYFNFLSSSVTLALQHANIFIDAPLFKVLLPVGISFYTFQSLSYVLDVYNERVVPERHLGYYALYVSFWPQLVAGPIERTSHLLPQFRQCHRFDADRVTSGLRLLLFGMLKKVAIADHLAIYVNRVYNHVGDFHTGPLVVATFFFAVQIYCDFSGYTDMARGAARVMGYDLMENFRQPYFAVSIHDFWRRWHISLSTWFRDYLYIPLGGNRGGVLKWQRNLMVTFFLSGLWHGANWTFVLWGGIHGCMLVVENGWNRGVMKFLPDGLLPQKGFLHACIRTGKHVLALCCICFAWIFFRANSVEDACTLLQSLFSFDFSDSIVSVVGTVSFVQSVVLILLLLVVDLFLAFPKRTQIFVRIPTIVRWSAYTMALWIVLISAIFGVRQQFIYFQF